MKNHMQQGVTLLIVVVILTALFSVGVGVFNVVFVQLLISGEARNSFIAFYAADHGIERTLYRDRQLDQISDGATETITLPSEGCYQMTAAKTSTVTIEVVGQYPCSGDLSRAVKRAFRVTY